MTSTLKFASALFAVAALGSHALPAAAQFAKAEDAIKYRRAAFTVMGTHFGRVAAMANGRAPFDRQGRGGQRRDRDLMVSKLPYTGFVEGSDKGETARRAQDLERNGQVQRAGASRMQEEMAKLNVAAKSGNLDAIKAAVGETGKTCKACHDDYRKE